MAAPSPAPTGGGSPAPSTKNVIAEMITSLLTTGALTKAAQWMYDALGGLPGIRNAIGSVRSDVEYADHHAGVVRARKFAWVTVAIYAFCVISKGIWRVYDIYDWGFMAGVLAMIFLLWVYYLPVKTATRAEHAAFRAPVDMWAKRVADQETWEYEGDSRFNPRSLARARAELTTAQGSYDTFVDSGGANNRSGRTAFAEFYVLGVVLGIGAFMAILRARTDGAINMDFGRELVVRIWWMSAAIFGVPMVALIYIWMAGMAPLIKGETFLVFVRRAITAGLLSSTDFAGVVKQEVEEMKAKGDDDIAFFAIVNFRIVQLLGSAIIKWLAATGLALEYMLANVSEWAFGASIVMFFLTEGIIAAFGDANEHRLKRRWFFRLVSSSTFLPYIHFHFAGRDATPSYTPNIDWWWKGGPFGPPRPDVTGVANAGEEAYDAAAPVVDRTAHSFGWYVSQLWHMHPVGWLILMGLLIGVGWIVSKQIVPRISEGMDAPKHKLARAFAWGFGALMLFLVGVPTIGLLIRAAPALNRTTDQVEREMRPAIGTVSSVQQPCQVDPTGAGRPQCLPQCFLAQNRVAPSTEAEWQQARGTTCFEP